MARPGPVAARLEGSRCPGCAVVGYPAGDVCARCGTATVAHRLSDRGTLWTWTVQRYAPKSPPYVATVDPYEPFVVGYVEMPDGVRVEAVVELDPEKVEIGMALELVPGAGVPRARAVTP